MVDLSWLEDNPSVEDAKAFIEKHPDALMGMDDYGCEYVPLHSAIYYRAPDEVILLLLKACPQAAAVDDYGCNVLHLAIDGDTTCSEKVIEALLNAHPGAASESVPVTGNLPLHVAVNKNASEGIILLLLNAYPQAAAEEMKDGRLLFEIFLERKASDDLMREICKVRIDGLLPLGVVLTKMSSDDIVLAVLKAYPEAAGKRFSTKFDECILPLHIAYEDKHSEKVQKALLDAYPGAAEKENPFETTHRLHKFLENEPLDPDGDDVKDLIKKYPDAAGKRGRDGRLPLHIAIDRIAPPGVTWILFEAYRQAGKEKMKDGRLPIDVFAEQKVTDDWPQETLAYMVTSLLENDMPVSIEDGTPVEHSDSWHACISYSTKTATDAVREVLLDSDKKWVRVSGDYEVNFRGGFGKHIHALAEARDAKGRPALGLASKESLEVIYEYLLFCGRYKLQIGPPEYRTATSVVLRAQDLAEQADYGVIFDKADKDEDGNLDRKELSSIAGSIGLDPDLFLNDSGKTTTTISKEEFVAACKRQLGDGPREVVIKLMQSKDHWERECNARKHYELESKYVVSALPNIPSGEAIAKAVRDGEGGLDIIKKKYLDNIEVGEHAFVMDAADRNMLQMFNQEQPKLDTIRVILRQVFEAVQHVHEKNLMHGEIKMVNIVQFRIDNKLRLIDLDASANISAVEESFAGAKFSSAILPPEMIERIETDEKLEEFNKYWKAENKDLVTKVSPKPYEKHGVKGHYVVKSFRTKEGKPVEEGLPYELVCASRSIDAWSLGVLAFTLLTGEPLIPSTRDDDCASGAAMQFLYSWGTRPEVLEELFNKISDPAGRDLVSQLLQYEPAKRPHIANLLKEHPFFNQQSVDLLEKLTDISTNLKDASKNRKDDRALLERMDANTADEVNVSNDSRNPVVDSEEIAKLVKAAATAAPKEATAAATTAAVAKMAVTASSALKYFLGIKFQPTIWNKTNEVVYVMITDRAIRTVNTNATSANTSLTIAGNTPGSLGAIPPQITSIPPGDSITFNLERNTYYLTYYTTRSGQTLFHEVNVEVKGKNDCLIEPNCLQHLVELKPLLDREVFVLSVPVSVSENMDTTTPPAAADDEGQGGSSHGGADPPEDDGHGGSSQHGSDDPSSAGTGQDGDNRTLPADDEGQGGSSHGGTDSPEAEAVADDDVGPGASIQRGTDPAGEGQDARCGCCCCCRLQPTIRNETNDAIYVIVTDRTIGTTTAMSAILSPRNAENGGVEFTYTHGNNLGPTPTQITSIPHGDSLTLNLERNTYYLTYYTQPSANSVPQFMAINKKMLARQKVVKILPKDIRFPIRPLNVDWNTVLGQAICQQTIQLQ